MQFISYRRAGLLAAAACMALLTTACTNLEAVRDWSKTSLQATEYNQIVTTYANTPERLKRYDSRHDWSKKIEKRRQQAKALQQVLSTVSDYMAALAALSSDNVTDYSKNADTVTKSIKKLNAGISDETLGALGSLVNTLFSASARAYQAKQLEAIIGEANAPLQKILKGDLLTIVDHDFRQDLNFEKISINGYYVQLKQTGKPSPAAKAALKEWRELRLQQNAERLKAVDAYVAVLKKIAAGHEKLYKHRNELDAKALAKELYSTLNDMRKQIQILVAS